MLAVAVRANRSVNFAARDQLAVRSFPELLLNAGVTFATGTWDIEVVNGRMRIVGAINAVRRATGRVAVVARCCQQHAAGDRPAMYRALESRYRLAIENLVFGGQVDILVTLSAGQGKVFGADARMSVRRGQNTMPAVTIGAARDIGVFACNDASVASVDFGHVRVAPAAVDRSDHVFVRESGDIGVAVDTLKAGMGRASQQFFQIAIFPFVSICLVATETGGRFRRFHVLGRRRNPGRCQKHNQGRGEKISSKLTHVIQPFRFAPNPSSDSACLQSQFDRSY